MTYLASLSRYPAHPVIKPPNSQALHSQDLTTSSSAYNAALSSTASSPLISPLSMTQKVSTHSTPHGQITTCIDLLIPKNFNEVLAEKYKLLSKSGQFSGNRPHQTTLQQTSTGLYSVPHQMTSAPILQTGAQKPFPKLPNAISAGQSLTPLKPSHSTTQNHNQQQASTPLSEHQAIPQQNAQTPATAHAKSPASPEKRKWWKKMVPNIKFRGKTAKRKTLKHSEETNIGSENVDESEKQEEEEENEVKNKVGKEVQSDSTETANSESTVLSSETSQERMTGGNKAKKNLKKIFTKTVDKVLKWKNDLTNWFSKKLAKRAAKKTAKKAAKEAAKKQLNI